MKPKPTLFLIPARAGSKGIPGKNSKPFCGRPLVCRAVDQALECASPEDYIFVSTDSHDIKQLAEGCGIHVPFMRPDELASDIASTRSVILHAIEEYRKLGQEFGKIVLLQPTSPFRTSEDILNAISLWNPDLDMVVSVSETKANPYFNLFEEDKSGLLHLSKGNGEYARRQDAPKVYEYNGAVYVINAGSIKKSPMSRFQKIKPYLMPSSRSVDLDSPQDWEIAEYLYEKGRKKQG